MQGRSNYITCFTLEIVGREIPWPYIMIRLHSVVVYKAVGHKDIICLLFWHYLFFLIPSLNLLSHTFFSSCFGSTVLKSMT
jgi:hypothetical protein